jgi:hypothetical protein
MKAPVVTLEDIEAVLTKLDRTRVNPTTPGNCVYTSETDPTHHCIVGQIWHELGRHVPGPGVEASARRVIADLGELDDYAPGVVAALQFLQTEADNLALSQKDDKSWGVALDMWPRIKREAMRAAVFSAPVPT